MKRMLLSFIALTFITCQAQQKQDSSSASAQKTETASQSNYKVSKTNAEWKAQLTPKQYHILRNAGTEFAFSGAYDKHYEKGVYICAGCGSELYRSEHKFNSGTGWPSFDRGVEDALEFDVDYKIGYARTELKCATCGGHLGHMFKDGPRDTTGERHCINSAALSFVPAKDTETQNQR